MTMLRALAIAVLGLVIGSPVRADLHDGKQTSLLRVGDVDGDGRDDLLVASRDDPPEVVWLLSGASGKPIREFQGRFSGDGFGCTLAWAGDVDQDGVQDFWIAAVGFQVWWWDEKARAARIGGQPYVELHSGKDGRLLRMHCLPEIPGCRRIALASGDLDADAVPDLLCGFSASGAGAQASVRGFSGRTGEQLFVIAEETKGRTHAFGSSVAVLGDLDGDGRAEFAVGDPYRNRPSSLPANSSGEGAVLLYSYASPIPTPGNVVWGDHVDSWFGSVIVPGGDLNGDGLKDLLVAAEARYASLYPVPDLTLLLRVESRHPQRRYYDMYASSLDVTEDLDADGVRDFLVGANESWTELFDLGYAELRSGKDGKLIRLLFESKKLGVDVANAGRVDADDVPDIALALIQPHPATPVRPKQYLPDPLKRSGTLRLLSGKDGSLIREVDLVALRTKSVEPAKTK